MKKRVFLLLFVLLVSLWIVNGQSGYDESSLDGVLGTASSQNLGGLPLPPPPAIPGGSDSGNNAGNGNQDNNNDNTNGFFAVRVVNENTVEITVNTLGTTGFILTEKLNGVVATNVGQGGAFNSQTNEVRWTKLNNAVTKFTYQFSGSGIVTGTITGGDPAETKDIAGQVNLRGGTTQTDPSTDSTDLPSEPQTPRTTNTNVGRAIGLPPAPPPVPVGNAANSPSVQTPQRRGTTPQNQQRATTPGFATPSRRTTQTPPVAPQTPGQQGGRAGNPAIPGRQSPQTRQTQQSNNNRRNAQLDTSGLPLGTQEPSVQQPAPINARRTLGFDPEFNDEFETESGLSSQVSKEQQEQILSSSSTENKGTVSQDGDDEDGGGFLTSLLWILGIAALVGAPTYMFIMHRKHGLGQKSVAPTSQTPAQQQAQFSYGQMISSLSYYISTNMHKGYTYQQLYPVLRQQGYTDQQIIQAYHMAMRQWS
ncbi:MAG: hypothetical protein QF632_03200 [Candidatus Woesearchaeota archaeon]|nr:hypothetical protein [Candidatus Woesearchaeota archaeon]MDP7457532.1 hypothetical protein [Candidatus Woesearchaeota archaeon]